MKIALDVMGGDNAPSSNILGVKRFLNNNPPSDIKIILVGDESLISEQLKANDMASSKHIKIHHAPDLITMDESKPALAFKNKPNSSIVRSINLVKEKQADAVISAGNTAALLASSLFVLGKIEGIKRPTLASYFPSKTGGFVLSDVGANAEVKPMHILQFAIMASIYAKHIKNTNSAKVGLLNIGAEKNKGNTLAQTSFDFLDKNIDGFVGNIEPRYIFNKDIDVVVCDGFTGNVVLKLTEGLISYFQDWITTDNAIKNDSKAVNAVNTIFNNYNYEEHGASPFLGVNGIVLKCHGSCSEISIDNSLNIAYLFAKEKLIHKIENELSENKIVTENFNQTDNE